MSSRLQARGNELLATLTVSFDFPVRFTRDVFAPSNPDLLAVLRRREPFRRHRVLFVLDSGLAKAQPWLADAACGYVRSHKGSLLPAGAPVVLEGGEACKNRAGAAAWLRARMSAAGLDRQAHVVVAGGGAVLDAAGYAAATFRHGLRLTRLPSTVLAQAGSAVSVKCGVNAFGRKNAVGVFAPPFGVVCDARLLDTLPARERAAGMAEAFKAALVGDAEFFHWICENAPRLGGWDRRVVDTLVRWSARLHLQHTAGAGDAFEQSRAQPLAFGHWDVPGSVGAALDLLLSRELCGLDAVVVDAAHAALLSLGLPLWDQGLEEPREPLPGDRSVTLLHDIAQPIELDAVDEQAVIRAVEALKRKTRRR